VYDIVIASVKKGYKGEKNGRAVFSKSVFQPVQDDFYSAGIWGNGMIHDMLYSEKGCRGLKIGRVKNCREVLIVSRW